MTDLSLYQLIALALIRDNNFPSVTSFCYAFNRTGTKISPIYFPHFTQKTVPGCYMLLQRLHSLDLIEEPKRSEPLVITEQGKKLLTRHKKIYSSLAKAL